MSVSLPKTLIPGTNENVADAQSNFDAVQSALNNVAGDVTGTIDALAVQKITKLQTRVGTGGLVESSAVDNVGLRSNFDPASGLLIDSTSPSWKLNVGSSDQITISRANATAGSPSYSTVAEIDSSGFVGVTVTVADNSVTSAKIVDGTIVDADISPTAHIQGSKVDLDTNGPANQATLRSLGPGSTQAAAGNHTHAISGVTGLQTALDAKASTSSVNTSLALKANKTGATFTGAVVVSSGGIDINGGGLEVTGGITLTSGATSLGGALTAEGAVQFNNGLDVDGAGTTLDGGTFRVQPLSGGGYHDPDGPSRLKVTATGIGFHGETPITRRTITGQRSEKDSTGALAHFLSWAEDIGFITDATTAG